jgi:ATP-dependent Clp protease ATP-binding subunit ClpC
MFEQVSERYRRVIFASVYVARRVGSPMIEAEHLLLGLLREDKSLARRFLGSPWAAEAVLRKVEKAKPAREKISGSFELPLSEETKRVMVFAAEEADLFSIKVRTEHILLGVLREEECLAAKILFESGVNLTSTRGELRRIPHDDSSAESFIRETGSLPKDVIELRNWINSIKTRMEEAIARNDFSKARSCAEEESEERDKLYELYRKYGLADWIFD